MVANGVQAAKAAFRSSIIVALHLPSLPDLNCRFLIFSAGSATEIVITALSNSSAGFVGYGPRQAFYGAHGPKRLLAGLLLCKSYRQPMVPTYTAKPARGSRYNVCRSARAPTWWERYSNRSAARMIEESVLE